MNSLDTQYQFLLQDILENGVKKEDRTGTGTLSVFGRTIRHNMSEGFPLLTTKKMAIKSVMTELKWFLKGDTNIRYLVQNGCNIWNGDAYKHYLKENEKLGATKENFPIEKFVEKIKKDKYFADTWGELGPVYGKQWRSWEQFDEYVDSFSVDVVDETEESLSFTMESKGMVYEIDQIQNVLETLKTNPDSRRMIVSAWNVGEIQDMVLPPCHNFFQFYTRELSLEERNYSLGQGKAYRGIFGENEKDDLEYKELFDKENRPKREISLMWNQRSVDTPLGLPFNIASYGMLLMLFSEELNMIPGELIGQLGDTHIYLNQIDGCREQIGRELSLEERKDLYSRKLEKDHGLPTNSYSVDSFIEGRLSADDIPKRTRTPFELPTVKLSNVDILNGEFDYEIKNYEHCPPIKFPLSN